MVMTDDEIRTQLLSDLAARAEDCAMWARRDRRSAASLAPGQDEARADYLRYAAHFDRYAAHYQQAIDLLKAAPMPAREEAK